MNIKMKKNMFRNAAVVAVALLAMTACDKSGQKVESNAGVKAPQSMKIAFVESDSIDSLYQFSKDCRNILTKKQQNIEATLNQRGQAFQSAYQNFVQKAQSNQLTQEQGQAQQAALQRQQQQLQELSQRLQAELQEETARYAQAINDSVQHYLKAFNKDRKYGLIFLKVGNNLLYADQAYNITKDVIAGLNKAYKTKPTATPAKKEAKKK